MKIPLTRNQYAIIDEEDYPLISNYSWYAWLKNGLAYAMGRRDGKIIKMHRLILGAKEGQEVDHRNGNGLDNRRSNLRLCSRTQNRANSRKQLNKSSPFKGVSRKTWGRYQTAIRVDKTFTYIGMFKEERHAAMAYDLWALDIYGEFARTNFPVVAHSNQLLR